MLGCGCTTAYGNTGLPNKTVIEGVTYSYILMPTYKEDGTLNKIDLSSLTLGADIKALVQASTAEINRLYPLPKMENVTKEKTETVFETAPSNKKFRIREGIRTNKGEFWDDNSPFQFMGELDKFGCTDMSYFRVDICGNLIGYKTAKDSTDLIPIPMDKSSYDTMLIFATDTTVQKLELQFEMEANFDESSFWILQSDDLGYNATTLRGLLTGDAVTSNVTTTSVDVTLTTCYGDAITLDLIVGLLPASFALFNDQTGTPVSVAIISADENPDGTYKLVYLAQTLNDAMRIEFNATGFDIADASYVAL